MRVMVVEDEALAGERLAWLCSRVVGVEIVGFTADEASVLRKIDELKPEVVFLDVSMPGLDGIELARILASRQHRPAIVFVTDHSSFAVAAFEVAATDCLLKPVSLARLKQALERAGASPSFIPAAPAYLNEIWVPHGRDTIRLGVAALDLLEAERDYVRLHCRGRTYLIRATIRGLERRLDPRLFLRVHRSAIVPIDRIRGLRRGGASWTILLAAGRIRVGRSFKSRVRAVTGGKLDDRRNRGSLPGNLSFGTPT